MVNKGNNSPCRHFHNRFDNNQTRCDKLSAEDMLAEGIMSIPPILYLSSLESAVPELDPVPIGVL